MATRDRVSTGSTEAPYQRLGICAVSSTTIRLYARLNEARGRKRWNGESGQMQSAADIFAFAKSRRAK